MGMKLKNEQTNMSQKSRAWRAFRRNKLACLGAVVLILILLGCVFAPLLTPYTPNDQDLKNSLSAPSGAHIFGTDWLGRDIFTRVLYGGRTTLLMSVSAIAMTVVAGSILGIAAGYCGGKIDTAIMCVMDVFSAIPSIVMAIAIVSFVGINEKNTMVAIAISATPSYVRVLRTAIMEVMDNPYIKAERVLGAGHIRIIFQDVLRNTLSPVLVHIITSIADAILVFSSLGYLRLSVQPPTPEWGNMVVAGMSSFYSNWHTLVYPCLAVVLTILSIRLLGNGLRDALDPSLSR